MRESSKKGYKVSTFDPKIKNFNLINKRKTDVIFNALHGRDGEDGIAQSYFEYLKIPYTHSGVVSSFNAMNKILSKDIFFKNKIKTPKYIHIDRLNFKENIVQKKINLKKIKFPIVSKPVNEGSSLGVEVCMNKKKLIKTINLLFKKYDELILEEYIGGQKFKLQ